MNKSLISTALLSAICMFASIGFCDTKAGEEIDGKKEFAEHCADCHPNGGNTVNAQKSLNMNSLKANGVNSTKDIIGKMRNPGEGMTAFDKKTVSDKEAKAIADYIMKTFK